MKYTLLLILAVITFQTHAGPPNYPKSPDPRLTPGSLCTEPETYRHPEQIPYCGRAVNFFMKEAVFVSYRKELGFGLNGDRALYKVDHFIPLCFGGSNNQDNLWPQHESISKISDPLEAMGCEKLGKGLITQKEMIELIVKAKRHLEEAPKIFQYLKKLR